MQRKKNNRNLTEKEEDILFVLATLEEVPEGDEILEELELARMEARKCGAPCAKERYIKKRLEGLRRNHFLKESMEITEKGIQLLRNVNIDKGEGRLLLNATEVLEIVRQKGKHKK